MKNIVTIMEEGIGHGNMIGKSSIMATKFMLHRQTPSQVAKDQLTMKDKRDEEEKLENKRKRRIVRPCLQRPRGSENRKKNEERLRKKEKACTTNN